MGQALGQPVVAKDTLHLRCPCCELDLRPSAAEPSSTAPTAAETAAAACAPSSSAAGTAASRASPPSSPPALSDVSSPTPSASAESPPPPLECPDDPADTSNRSPNPTTSSPTVTSPFATAPSPPPPPAAEDAPPPLPPRPPPPSSRTLELAVSSMQGWRLTNEDQHIAELCLPSLRHPHLHPGEAAPAHADVCLCAVLDGHGGPHAAREAARRLPAALSVAAAWEQHHNMAEALEEAFLAVDAAMAEEVAELQAGELGEEARGGTTVTLAALLPHEWVFANCGDSRAVLADPGGRVLFATADHKPELAEESARILAAGLSVEQGRVSGRLAVSRALGDFAFKDNPALEPAQQAVSPLPTITRRRRRPAMEGFLVLACDGVWDVMSSEQVAETVCTMLRAGMPAPLVCEQLLDLCLHRGSRDNMTLLLLLLPAAPRPEPGFQLPPALACELEQARKDVLEYLAAAEEAEEAESAEDQATWDALLDDQGDQGEAPLVFEQRLSDWGDAEGDGLDLGMGTGDGEEDGESGLFGEGDGDETASSSAEARAAERLFTEADALFEQLRSDESPPSSTQSSPRSEVHLTDLSHTFESVVDGDDGEGEGKDGVDGEGDDSEEAAAGRSTPTPTDISAAPAAPPPNTAEQRGHRADGSRTPTPVPAADAKCNNMRLDLLLVTGSDDGKLGIWDADDGRALHTLNLHREGALRKVVFAPDGTFLATASYDKTLAILEPREPAMLTRLHGHTAAVWSVAVAGDGSRLIASGGNDSTVRLWQASGGEALAVLDLPKDAPTEPPEPAPSSDLVLFEDGGGADGAYDGAETVCALAFIDGSSARLASAGSDRKVRLWDTGCGKAVLSMGGHDNHVLDLAVGGLAGQAGPAGLASCSSDRSVRVWDWRTGDCVQQLAGHTDWVLGLAFSRANPSHLASVSDDRSIRIWDLRSPQQALAILENAHKRNIMGVAFSYCGAYMATGSWDHSAKLWDAATFQPIKTITGINSDINTVAFSP